VTGSTGEAQTSARRRHYELDDLVPVEVIPMGIWAAGTPQASVQNLNDRRVVFLGSLVERIVVDLYVDNIAMLKQRGTPVSLDVIGGGPLLHRLETRIDRDGLRDVVTLHRFVADPSTTR